MTARKDPLRPRRRPAWRGPFDRTVGTFFTGLLFLLPFLLTLLILDWLARQLILFFGTESLLGSAVAGSSSFLFGDASFGVWLFLTLIVAGIWGIGRLFQTRAKKSIQERIDGWVDRIPIIGGIYRPISRITRMIGLRDENELAAMRPIAVRFGSAENGTDVLALLASPTPVMVGTERRMLVYLPSAPIPMTGFLSLVPEANVVKVEGIGVDDLLKFYISVGTVMPSGLEPAPPDVPVTPVPEAPAATR
ncbi:MAG: DUF502 domain-containing protein [Pseudomonadota bacterium]